MNGETQRIPEEIAATLRGLIYRMRRVILLRGLCTVAAVWIVALLGGMAVDAGLVLFSQWTRWLLALCFYGCVGWAVLRFILKPLSTTFSLAGIARVIEMHHPELQERISSAVELITSRDDPGIRGSDALIAELVREAQADALLVRPRQEISLKALRRPVAVAAGAFVILLALTVAWPRQTVRLALRTSAPFLNLPNVRAADLVVEPGDTVLCAGERLRVNVGVGAKPVDAIDL
ncbi:MAG: hypothetical protein IT195_13815, partial [Microthrixaceae bacterium]|nr:hypothetical protein [Microthrixaceae bacterium]